MSVGKNDLPAPKPQPQSQLFAVPYYYMEKRVILDIRTALPVQKMVGIKNNFWGPRMRPPAPWLLGLAALCYYSRTLEIRRGSGKANIGDRVHHVKCQGRLGTSFL